MSIRKEVNSSPIKIIPTNHTCNDLCDFKFNYGVSDCAVTNNGNSLLISHNSQNDDIMFNKERLTVTRILVYPKPLYKYNGTQPDAELHIYLTGTISSNVINVIPIHKTSGKDNTTNIFDLIMNNVSDVVGEKHNVPVSKFTLNDFTPRAGYYYYYGSDPQPNSSDSVKYDILIFDNQNSGFIHMSNESITKLQKLLTLADIKVHNIESNELFYNKVGTIANDSDGTDDIYIDCQLVDEDGEVVVSESSSGKISQGPIMDESMKKGFDNFVKYVLPILGILIIIFVLHYLLNLFYKSMYIEEAGVISREAVSVATPPIVQGS